MVFRRLMYVALLGVVLAGCQMGTGMYGGNNGGGTVKGSGFNGTNMAGIAISGFAFSPSTVTFPASNNVTVTWTNYDGILHSVTPDAGNTLPSFGSDVTSSYSYAVPSNTPPGTYSYHCRIHTYMTGSITVQ